ncbi:hypothetical protein [Mycobacterium sp. 1274761.0]|uniref:hypothetical protein n=1 Tax=Mycobacterium sp. 1274761.0 TaxID=1834077 RepID=UPI0008022E90|nr:hypothetical protein [Mycobacterium sp. 1274761.0]OBK70651.1 hypothetical protein A5651_20595 [Mycobacterium sp. 1274761.0]
MLTLRDHDVEDYEQLADMDASDVGVLTVDDRETIEELGDYLVASGGWDRFAVWLLHKHFLPEPGEVFVERAIARPPQTHTTLIDRAAFSTTGLQPTSLRFDSTVTSGIGLVGMEFAGPADFGPAAPLGPHDEEVLAGFAERLRERGKMDRFGVRLIRNQLGISDDKDLMETCDKPRRALHCAVIDSAAVPDENAIETTWRVKPVAVADGPSATTWCGGVHCYHYCWGC